MIAKYRQHLPLLNDQLFLTDGGIETTLIYHDGFELPLFAAFDLVRHETGREALRRYYRAHAAIAREQRVGFILESATWRASADWGERLGYSPASLAAANQRAIAMLHELRDELETDESPMVISGCIGPRGDGYKADVRMTAAEAETYHSAQVQVFAAAGADLVSAITMTCVEEAIGAVRAARAAGMPVVVSFTTETDGQLPSGQSLESAIIQTDAATDAAPVYYMINCAHPTHFLPALTGDSSWLRRIRGVRANASKKSHAELDTSTELDAGDPAELAERCVELCRVLPALTVLGGCCGTDARHIRAIGEACGRAWSERKLPRCVSQSRTGLASSTVAPLECAAGKVQLKVEPDVPAGWFAGEPPESPPGRRSPPSDRFRSLERRAPLQGSDSAESPGSPADAAANSDAVSSKR